MTTDFDIAGHARVCAATGRELKPGERVYGVLTESAGRFARADYAADAWAGPPADAIAHWSGRIPSSSRPAKPTFNDALLLDCFDHLAGAVEPNRVSFRYVVALLLMRRKKLKFEDAKRTADGTELLILRDARTGRRHEVPDPKLPDDQIEAVQQQVFQVQGWQ